MAFSEFSWCRQQKPYSYAPKYGWPSSVYLLLTSVIYVIHFLSGLFLVSHSLVAPLCQCRISLSLHGYRCLYIMSLFFILPFMLTMIHSQLLLWTHYSEPQGRPQLSILFAPRKVQQGKKKKKRIFSLFDHRALPAYMKALTLLEVYFT